MKSSDLFHAVILFILATAIFVAIGMSARSVAHFAQHLRKFSAPTPRPAVYAPRSIQILA